VTTSAIMPDRTSIDLLRNVGQSRACNGNDVYPALTA